MKLFKGVMLYTLILIGVLCVVGALLFGAMFLIPSFRPFGFGALNLNKSVISWDYTEKLYIENATGGAPTDYTTGSTAIHDGTSRKVYDLSIDAGGYAVTVLINADLNNIIRAGTVDKVFGLYRGNESVSVETFVDIQENVAGGVINVKVSTPEFSWLRYKGSVLYVEIPKDYSYNLNIKTTSGDVVLQGRDEAPLFVHNLSVETGSGGLMAAKLAKLSDEKIENARLAAINLKTISGTFDLSGIDTVSIQPENGVMAATVLDSDRGNFLFNTLSCGPLVIMGENVRIDAKVIKTNGNDLTYRAPNGYFTIETLDTTSVSNPSTGALVTIVTNNTEISLGTLIGESIISTTYGNITINTKLKGSAKINSTHGDISVALAEGRENGVSLSSRYGSIYVRYEGNASISNINGSVTADFVAGKEKIGNFTILDVAKGSVTLLNQINDLTVIARQSANVTINFNKLYVQNPGSSDIVGGKYKITTQGSSSVQANIPLAGYNLDIYPEGSTNEQRAKNNIPSNLFAGQSKIEKDETYTRDINSLALAKMNICALSGTVSLNSYNKDSLLGDADRWFQLNIYKAKKAEKGYDADGLIKGLEYYRSEYYDYQKGTNLIYSGSGNSLTYSMSVASSAILTDGDNRIVLINWVSNEKSVSYFTQSNGGAYKKVDNDFVAIAVNEEVAAADRYALAKYDTGKLFAVALQDNKANFYLMSSGTLIKVVITFSISD